MTELSRTDQALQDMGQLSSENILDIKQFLSKDWKPRTAAEAIKVLNLLHVLNAAGKHLKTESYAFLDRCSTCDGERVDPVTGLKVLRKSKAGVKVYNETEETIRLEVEMAKLKIKLRDAKDRAGYTTVEPDDEDGFNYSVKF